MEYQTKVPPMVLISAHSSVRPGYLSMVYVTRDAPGPTMPAQSPAYLFVWWLTVVIEKLNLYKMGAHVSLTMACVVNLQ